ncbi:MAG: outer membrane beta-barrel protein [Desulfovibrio sp.]|jgi:outer membrane autotransporter protein|nr:outer membrane beta-barrel protein [Desulfovibrio sp.]
MKRGIAVLAVVFTLLAPSLSAAEGTGMYLAPKFLMSFQNTGTMSRSSHLQGSGLDSYSQFTLGGGLAAGYDFWPQQMLPLRAEVEFALRGNSEKGWNSDGAAFVDDIKGTWNNSTLFANLYWDFHNDSALTPYVGGGLGMAFNYTGYDFYDKNIRTKISMDDHYTNLAWNLGAGVAFSFNDNFAVDLGYRFVYLGYNEVSTIVGGSKVEISNRPYNNEFMLGLRFMF